MKKRILFIYPPPLKINRETTLQQPLAGLSDSKLLPPTDLMQLAAVAQKANCEAKISDYSLGGNLDMDLATFKPDFVLANVSTPSFKSDLDTLKHIKELLPNAKIIATGAIFQTYNINAIYEKTYLDYVIVGETELTLKEILENQPDEEILGLCHRKNFQGVKNPPRPLNENLDELPFLARDLVDNCIYIGFNKKPQAVINVSKGCPHNCFHCLATSCNGEKIRSRSAQSIISEIKECINKYNIKTFYFNADNFGYNTLWLIDFCDKLIKEKLNIVWSAKICTTTISPELALIMQKSGCKQIEISIKHACQSTLNNIGKVCTIKEISNTIQALKKSKIKIIGDFILGLPWETEKSISETTSLAKNLKCDSCRFFAAVPFPNTKFYQYAMQNRLFDLTSTYERAYSHPVIRTHELTKEKLAELIKNANLQTQKRNIFRFIKII